jgi:hypothetical protein
MTLFTFIVSAYGQDDYPLIFIATAIVGCFLTAVVSVGFEYGTHLAIPANEAVVGGIYNVFAQAGGCILVWVGGKIFENGDDDDKSSSILTLNYLLSGVLLGAGVLYVVGMKQKGCRII